MVVLSVLVPVAVVVALLLRSCDHLATAGGGQLAAGHRAVAAGGGAVFRQEGRVRSGAAGRSRRAWKDISDFRDAYKILNFAGWFDVMWQSGS